MDYSMYPDQTDAETNRLLAQANGPGGGPPIGANTNPLQSQALVGALRRFGAGSGMQQPNRGQMVGRFYVPPKVNPVTSVLGAGSSLMGSFGGQPGQFAGMFGG